MRNSVIETWTFCRLSRFVLNTEKWQNNTEIWERKFKHQWSQIKTKPTNKYTQHGTRSWLYILNSAHLPQITTYFLRYSRETALVSSQETCCVLCFVWNFSNFNRFEQEKEHFERPRRQSCALAKLATFFTFLAGKSLLPLIFRWFQISLSWVAWLRAAIWGWDRLDWDCLFHLECSTDTKVPQKGSPSKKQIWSLP